MEGCLLCLDINKEFVDSIKVDSPQWEELNIKNLIEKHLWIMETILPSSWLCKSCWQTLDDFHKFYIRIEEAHLDFGKMMKTENEQELQKDECSKNKNDDFVKVDLNEPYLEPEILINQLILDDKTVCGIKEEEIEDFFLDDNLPLTQRSSRRQHLKDNTNDAEPILQDPLSKSKKSKSYSKRKKSKIETNVETTELPVESIFDNSDIKSLEMKKDPEPLKISDNYKMLPDTSDSDNNDFNADNDYIPEKETKRSTRNAKKKSSNKIKSASSDTDSEADEAKQPKQPAKKKATRSKVKAEGSNTDSEKDVKKEPKRQKTKHTFKERDQFLKQNFKITCALCQISIDDFKSLLTHFEEEHKEKGYAVCCNKKFFSRFKLVQHVHTHVDPNKFKCSQCGKLFTNKNLLSNHEATHLTEDEKKYPCTECGKKYAKPNLLSFHVRTVHLKKYLKICEICGKSLRGEFLERHMLVEHEGKPAPLINCEVCGKGLSTKKALKRHMETQHYVGEKQLHTCHICFKISPNIHALKKHIDYVHTDKLRNCTMCGRGFKSNLALREHMATHTGVALYTCPWCPKTFNANAALHVHRKKLHPAEWEEFCRQRILERYKLPKAAIANSSAALVNSSTAIVNNNSALIDNSAAHVDNSSTLLNNSVI